MSNTSCGSDVYSAQNVCDMWHDISQVWKGQCLTWRAAGRWLVERPTPMTPWDIIKETAPSY